MKCKKVYYILATFGGIGKMPAPGTVATIISLLPMAFLHYYTTLYWYLIILCVCVALSLHIIARVLVACNLKGDPGEIVLDEFVGCLVTFCFVPLSWQTILIGVVLFRFFDISKCAIGWSERIPGAAGIVFDDIVAGCVSNGLLQLFLAIQ